MVFRAPRAGSPQPCDLQCTLGNRRKPLRDLLAPLPRAENPLDSVFSRAPSQEQKSPMTSSSEHQEQERHNDVTSRASLPKSGSTWTSGLGPKHVRTRTHAHTHTHTHTHTQTDIRIALTVSPNSTVGSTECSGNTAAPGPSLPPLMSSPSSFPAFLDRPQSRVGCKGTRNTTSMHSMQE
eukprot:1160884-Pelagomonas_calceolata.AAC.9